MPRKSVHWRLVASQSRKHNSLALTEHLQTSIEQSALALQREIHDDIGGALTAVKFDIAWIGRHADTLEMKEACFSCV